MPISICVLAGLALAAAVSASPAGAAPHPASITEAASSSPHIGGAAPKKTDAPVQVAHKYHSPRRYYRHRKPKHHYPRARGVRVFHGPCKTRIVKFTRYGKRVKVIRHCGRGYYRY